MVKNTKKTPRITSSSFAKFQYFQLQKVLFIKEEYSTMSLAAKIMYSLFLDRAKLSDLRGFRNKDNEPYFFYSRDSMAKMLSCSTRKVTQIKQELVDMGLLDVEETGRSHRMYLRELSYDKTTSEELEIFEAPEEDLTKWSKESIEKIAKLRRKNHLLKGIKILKSNSYLLNKLSLGDVQNLHITSKIASNQPFCFLKKNTKCRICTSEVQNLHTSKTNIVKDNISDHYIDQSSLDSLTKNNSSVSNQKDELQKLLDEQFLYDLRESNNYHTTIVVTLKALANSEDIEMLHSVLQNVLQDIIYGKFIVAPDFKPYKDKVNDILSNLGFYDNPEIANATRFAIIRGYRMMERQEVKNRKAYYFKSISKAILEYIASNYEIGIVAEDDWGLSNAF